MTDSLHSGIITVLNYNVINVVVTDFMELNDEVNWQNEVKLFFLTA